MVRTGSLLVAVTLAAVALQGCFSAKEPLVNIDTSGFSSGGSRPDTRVKPSDSDEVRQLKEEVARLQHKVGDLEEDADKEKAKRKQAEDERKQWEKQADRLKDQIKELQKQLQKARGG